MSFSEIMDSERQLDLGLKALDGCSSKKTNIGQPDVSQRSRMLVLTCAKYPEGTQYTPEATVSNPRARSHVAARLGCMSCEFSAGDPDKKVREAQVETFHEKIKDIPGRLYIEEHFTEAVFRGLVTVKETLREVSNGHESAAEAIGKGGLYFLTKRGEHVERSYQQAAQFSLMAIDNLRNVEAHSLPHEDEIKMGADYAHPRLMLCTLALNFLDNTEIRK